MRFYFDIHDRLGVWPDEEGLDLEDVRAAEVEAARSLADVAKAATHRQGGVAIAVRTSNGALFVAAKVF